MGLNITDDRHVEFDDSHQHRVDTSLTGNPRSLRKAGIRVHYVFQRNQGIQKDTGDGNPLIYALKEMKGFRIASAHRQMFLNRAAEILDRIDTLEADAVLATPSSKPFSAEFAELVARRIGVGVLPTTCVAKRTVQDMLDTYGVERPRDRNRYRDREIVDAIKGWRKADPNSLVSMKEVTTQVRSYFAPLALGDDSRHLRGMRVVVTDDLMSSGSTLISMRSCLTEAGADLTSSVFFLSDL